MKEKENIILFESELRYYEILIPYEFIILLYNDFALKRCTTLTPKRIKYNLERRMKEYGANWIVEFGEEDNDICGLRLRSLTYYLSKAQLEMFSVIAKYIKSGSFLLFCTDDYKYWRILFKDNSFIIEKQVLLENYWEEIDKSEYPLN